MPAPFHMDTYCTHPSTFLRSKCCFFFLQVLPPSGCVCVCSYTMIFGKPPFETSNVKATYRKIRANAYCFPEGVDISPMARDLIVRTLQGDPSKRPSVEQMMQHPFFTDYPIPETLDVHALREEPVLPQHYFLPLTGRDRALRGASKRQSSSSTSSSSSSTTTASASSSVALSSSTGRAQKTSAKDLHQGKNGLLIIFPPAASERVRRG